MPLINFAGLASGIDSNALIDAITTAAKQARVKPSEEKVSELEATNSTLSELKDKLRDLQSISRKFSTLEGGAVVKTGKSTDETKVTASAANSASNGSYAMTVSTLAKNATYGFKSTAGTYTSADAAIGSTIASPSNVVVTVGTLASAQEIVTVSVDSTTTLNQFATAYNNAATTSIASVVNVGTSASPDYRIVINTNYEGTEKGNISVSVGATITAVNAFNNNSTSQATNATFTITGIGAPDTITRQTNQVSDVITGVTFNLQAAGSATVTVADDAPSTSANVQEFVTAYNDLVSYIKENDLITRKEDSKQVDNIFGPLANTRVDDNVLQAIRNDIVGSTYDSGSQVKIFADLGITTERDGTLKFNSDVLEQAIADEAPSVAQILQNFGDQIAVTGGTIDNYIRFSGLIDVTIDGNTSLITNLNDQIARAEASISREADTLRQRYARLEGLIGSLQSQQNALTSALAGLQ